MSLELFELPADDIFRTRFIEEPLAVFEQVHVLDTRLDNGIPTRLTRPPVAPEVEIGADGLVAVFERVGYCTRLTVILRVTTFTELVAVARGYPALHALAPVLSMVAASVRPPPDYLAVLNDYGGRFYDVVERMFSCIFTRLHHERIVRINVLDDAAGGEVGIGNSRHERNFSTI